jgi:hypothetical protein
MRHHHPDLFDDIAWGTPQVLETTLQRCRALGLSWFCLPQRADLDTPEDYRELFAGNGSRQPAGPGSAI